MTRVLIIDDDTTLSEIYQMSLEEEGISVTTAESGKEALAKIKQEKPDVVLLDIMLPRGMNGFDVIEQIKSDPETKEVPVIMMTNLDSEKAVAMELGAQDYVVKAGTTIPQVTELIKKAAAR